MITELNINCRLNIINFFRGGGEERGIVRIGIGLNLCFYSKPVILIKQLNIDTGLYQLIIALNCVGWLEGFFLGGGGGGGWLWEKKWKRLN